MIDDLKSQTGEPRRAGRPPALTGPERRDRILAAAEAVFFDKGYAAASMDDVAQACGMSKKTLYRFFATKQALFNDLVAATIDSLPLHAVEADGRAEPEALLRELLTGLAALLLQPRQLALLRLVVAEARHAPELADGLRDIGMARAEAIVCDLLTRLARRGPSPWPADLETSRILIGATVGDVALKLLIGIAPAPTLAEIEARFDRLLALTARR